MGWTKIDRTRWKREAFFRHYHEDAPCFYSMTVSLDVTRLRAAGIRLYPAMLYALCAVVNRREEFRTAMVNGAVGVYDALSPCYTVFHPQTETFSNLWTAFCPDFPAFLARYEEDLRRYGHLEGFMPKPDAPENLFTVSMLPWARFEGFHLDLPRGNDYLLPIFTLGKMYAQDGRTLLPMAVQVHHAVCDGFHVCRLIRETQELIDAPETWRGN